MKVATASRPDRPTRNPVPSGRVMVSVKPSGLSSSAGARSTLMDAASKFSSKDIPVSIVGRGTAMVARGGVAGKAPWPATPRAAVMEWHEAQAFAFALIIASGKPHGQVWHELRRAQGFAGRRRRVDPPFSAVVDAVASLVLSANQPGPEQGREFGILVMLYGQAGQVRP